jgi:hypothetical protein
MQFVRIMLLSLCAGIAYGIVHDQITIRVCLEYFTIGHPQIFRTSSPTLLALGWGVVATWWVALPLGFSLASAAQLGRRPKRSAGDLVRPLAWLFAAMGMSALAAGVLGYTLARNGVVSIDPWVGQNISVGEQPLFMADWWAHSSSYVVGIFGGAVLCFRVWRDRAHVAGG